ncbi:hypothetical protein PROFUN_10550 [Planoprotostelium fungivorum]|uniref:NAD-dependent epimerase/dehydratase domain-containing protein n=1 Tax=Planoprotostelium fungivorum TaxID=1890364 RepID=A0A2P6N6T1_9EUKA|nr:hypothetical protein PROFUN_10550 [Planoprotostelium fungivorum]
MSSHRVALVTGANGSIGNAVARAFVRAGWKTFGLIRNASAISLLSTQGIIPISGSPSDLSFLNTLYSQSVTFDVIVSNTEQLDDYDTHFQEILRMVRQLAEKSTEHGIRPLLMFTSGCKDYGQMDIENENSKPHTEESPLNPPPVLAPRTKAARSLLSESTLDVVILRPTTVFGLGGSLYGPLFEIAERSQDGLIFHSHPKTMMHGLHLDDCGEAYVSIAQHAQRRDVMGQCFNISGHRYETLDEVAAAVQREYGITRETKYEPKPLITTSYDKYTILTGFSQWVSSDKLRNLTGWKDEKALFSEGIHIYRKEYEIAKTNSSSV